MPSTQPVQFGKRTKRRHHNRHRPEQHEDELVLTPSVDCVVGFQRVTDLRHALRAARRQGLKIQYIQSNAQGVPLHAVVEWKGTPVIITDCYDGSEIH